jgi:hypothetical protein
MSTDPLGRPAHGVVLALAAAVSVGAWAVHVFALTSLVRLNQLHHGVVWIMNGITVLTAIPCLVAIGLGVAVLRRTSTPESEGSPIGRTVFLAWMAVATGGFSLLLILLEAIYVIAIDRYA